MPLRPPKQINMFDALSNSDADVADPDDEFENLEKQSNSGGADMKLKNSNDSYASVLNSTQSNKKWSDFFRASSSSHQEEKHALEEDGGPQEVYSHGTCIVGIASEDFVLLFADGRGSIEMGNDKDGFDLVVEGNATKLFVIGSQLIAGVAGDADLGISHIKFLKEVLGNYDDTNNIDRFAKITEFHIKEKYKKCGLECPFDIIAVGYIANKPHIYTSIEGLHPARFGTFRGIGSGFTYAAAWLGNSLLEGSKEHILSLIKETFVVVCLQDQACGGYCWSGTIGPEIDATLKREGHIIKIARSTFKDLEMIWEKVILIETDNNTFSHGDFGRVNDLILSEFPGYKTFNLFGMIPRKGTEEKDLVLWAILYGTKAGLLADQVVYGKRSNLKAWQPSILKPKKKIFAKYSRILKDVSSQVL